MITINEPIEFQWDKGNQDKNWDKHGVTQKEAEEVFSDKYKKIAKDFLHSKKEDRYLLVGITVQNRALFIVFTIRKQKIRIISARDLNKRKERSLYEKTT